MNGELANLLNIDNAKDIYSQQTTKGVLEMGGESLQITFIPQESSLNSLKAHNHGDIVHHIETVNIGDMEFQLFTYSWMVRLRFVSSFEFFFFFSSCFSCLFGGGWNGSCSG